jgi:ferritin-like metal-binding protein YciE
MKHEAKIEDFFECSLQNMLQAEEDILKQLNLISKVADSKELKQIFQEHMEETKVQADRLKKAIQTLESKSNKEESKEEGVVEKGKKMAKTAVKSFSSKSEAIDGIVKQGEKVFKEFSDTSLHDLVLASGAQALEMGEIAAYKTLLFLADLCGHSELIEPLQQSLDEEQKAYETLRGFCNEEGKKVEKSA